MIIDIDTYKVRETYATVCCRVYDGRIVEINLKVSNMIHFHLLDIDVPF